jgi:hypothetical protein
LWTDIPEAATMPLFEKFRTAFEKQRAVIVSGAAPLDETMHARIYPSVDGVTVLFLPVAKGVQIKKKIEHAEA